MRLLDLAFDVEHGVLSLEVQNFGPIKTADVKLRPLTVIIGPNNAGKSYLALLTYALHNPFGRSLGGSLGGSLFRLGGAFAWNRMVHVEGSKEAKLAVRAWLQQWRKDRKDIKFHELPSSVQGSVVKVIDRFMKEIPRLLTSEVQRCFASELDDLIRSGVNGDCTLVVKQQNPILQLSMVVSGKRLKLLKKNMEIGDVIIAQSDLGRYPSQVAEDILPGLIMGQVLGELTRVSSYYLPAARSGILQGHKLLASVVLSRIPLVGIEALNIPKLSGVVADFISNLLSLERNEKSKVIPQIAEFLENEVCKGRIERKAGEERIEFPEIYYQIKGKEIPLHRTSSMVSEIAPIVLFLKFLVHKGNLLIIEEPEAHLHPDSQRAVARAIVRLIRAGVRVLVTTHSDYFVQQISNFILMGRSVEERARLGYSANDYLNAEEVGAYLFQVESDQSGSTTRELEVTEAAGIPEDEFVAIAESIYKESALLEQPH